MGDKEQIKYINWFTKIQKINNDLKYQAFQMTLPLTGVLPNRDSEIRGAIMWIAKANVFLKPPVNIENTYQEPIERVWQGNKS